MKYFDTFSGIGGFALGIQKAHPDWECIGFSEIDKYAKQIYLKHLNHKDYGNIRDIRSEDLPDFDLFCGGFPCQTFSIAGKRQGFKDITRGTLFFEITRILSDKRPRYLLLENVKGLLTHDSGKTFTTILRVLTDIGYDLQWHVFNSKDYGVPQNRERVYIIGNLRGERRPEIFSIGNSVEIHNESGENKKEIYASTLTARQFSSWNGNYIKQMNNPIHSNDRVYNPEGIAPTLNTMQGGNRQPFIALKTERTVEAKAIRNESMKNGKDWSPRQGKQLSTRDDNLMNTITANWEINQALTDGQKIRRLTPIECERLQGFPDNWTKGISDSQRYKCLGNAVTVNVVEYIFNLI